MIFLADNAFSNGQDLRKKQIYRIGDRVQTYNNRKGEIVRIERDEFGEYVVVKLDNLSWEYAYDPWDLIKTLD